MDCRKHYRRCRSSHLGQAGDDEVILGLSGGVDFLWLHYFYTVLSVKLHCVFVDNGLPLLPNEGDQVMEMLHDKSGLNITRVDAESRF